MPDKEVPSAQPSATRPGQQPGLLASTDPSQRTRPANDASQMRMLDELEAVVRPRRHVERSNAPLGWLIALLAGGVAVAAAVWWTQPNGAASPPRVALVASAPTPAAAARPAAVADVASAPAVIETVAAATPEADSASAVGPLPAAAPAPTAMSAPRRPARKTATRAATAASSAAGSKVTTVVTSTGGTWTVTVTQPAPADTPPAAASTPPPTTRGDTARTAQGEDGDVRLLSASLAHGSRSRQPGSAAEDHLTIAQIVKRCDARPAGEVQGCRRRICEGYWGKAEACPAPAPVKKG